MSSNISIDFQDTNKNETPITQIENKSEPLPVDLKDSSTTKRESKQTKESKQTYLLTEEELQLIQDKFYSDPEGGSLLAEAMETNAYYPENDLAADVLRNKYLAPN